MRREDWLERLWATVETAQRTPFAWGANDCTTFAAACIDAMTGSDWRARLAAAYTDEASARAYIVAEGGIEAGVTRRLGEPVASLQARRGDVCLVETPEGPGLAICVGPVAVVPGATGLVRKPLRDVIKAWRVD